MENRKVGILKTKDSEIVKVQMWFKNGSASEPFKQNGYIHLLEHIKIANDPFKGEFFSKKLLYGVTTKELLKFSYFVHKKDLLRTLVCFIDNLLDTNFDEHIIDIQKQQVINELNYYNRQRTMILINKAIDCIFKNNNLSNCSGGVIDVVKEINEDQLIKYNQKVFEESDFLLTCVGDIDHISVNDELSELIYKKFKFKCTTNTANNDLIEGKSIISINKDRYSECLFTYILPGTMRESYIYTKVIETLFKNVLGDIYGVNIKLYSFSEVSLFMFYILCNTKEEIELALKMINTKMEYILDKEEIKKAIETFRLQLFYDNTSLTKKADYYTESILYGYDITERISSLEEKALVYDVMKTIKDMINRGSVSVVITEDIFYDEKIRKWELRNEVY